MHKNEHETIILINEGDLEEGFFRFYTTKHNDFLRLKQRLGDLITPDLIRKTSISTGGSTYEIRVPRGCYSPRTFTIKKPRISPHPRKGINPFKKEPK